MPLVSATAPYKLLRYVIFAVVANPLVFLMLFRSVAEIITSTVCESASGCTSMPAVRRYDLVARAAS